MRTIILLLSFLITSESFARTNGNVYRMPGAGNIPSWGPVNMADGTNAVTGVLGISNGGSGQTSANAALNAFLPSQTGNANKCLKTDGTNTSWAAFGTGNGTVTSVDASVPSFLSISGNPITTSGTLAITYSGTALPIANGGTNSTTALSGSSIMISNGTSVVQGAAGTSTTLLHGNASGAPTYSAVSLTADVTGTLTVSNGGTGASSLTANNVLLGNGTSALQVVAPGTSGNVLTSNGTTWTSAAPATGTGLLNAKFDIEGAVVPYIAFGGTHYQTGTQSLTSVFISMLNSGTSGSTQIRVNQYRSGSLQASATASLSASSGNPAGTSASLSGTLSLLAADIITVDVVSVAGGSPENLTVEY